MCVCADAPTKPFFLFFFLAHGGVQTSSSNVDVIPAEVTRTRSPLLCLERKQILATFCVSAFRYLTSNLFFFLHLIRLPTLQRCQKCKSYNYRRVPLWLAMSPSPSASATWCIDVPQYSLIETDRIIVPLLLRYVSYPHFFVVALLLWFFFLFDDRGHHSLSSTRRRIPQLAEKRKSHMRRR